MSWLFHIKKRSHMSLLDYDPFHDFELLNIAAVGLGLEYLGPGFRSVIWVQGCPFKCKGCVAPDWIPIQPARLIKPDDLLGEIFSDPRVEGLTFSGGEPMLQAQGLSRLARLARQVKDLSIICYSGFQYRQLIHHPPGPGVSELLSEIDVLIDGPYIQDLNDNKGLRGSSNQRVHYFTDRLRHFDFDTYPRKSILHVQDGHVMLVGVPSIGVEKAFRKAVETANQLNMGLLNYERV